MNAARIATALAAVGLAAGATGAHAADYYPPTVDFTTPSTWPVVGGPVPGVGVEGTATDDASGVARVTVDYCSPGAVDSYGGYSCGSGYGVRVSQTVEATVTCSDATRRSCTWVANAPLQPERYIAFANAWDALGHKARTEDPIWIVVV